MIADFHDLTSSKNNYAKYVFDSNRWDRNVLLLRLCSHWIKCFPLSMTLLYIFTPFWPGVHESTWTNKTWSSLFSNETLIPASLLFPSVFCERHTLLVLSNYILPRLYVEQCAKTSNRPTNGHRSNNAFVKKISFVKTPHLALERNLQDKHYIDVKEKYDQNAFWLFNQ